MTRLEKKKAFIAELAKYLADNQAEKGIALQLESKLRPVVPWAREWAKVRGASPLFGYPTIEEAEAQLTEFLL